ncbi:LytR/AlgR family response regulator transcription factor [Aquimarina muelleri]|uniref:DNA-binding response regulator n=1 Tax=Aquimarina muelleri TaxID=279356 RepID=A0A918JQT8_9FLAO|nr:LytTR family DNA-binding domain-containing protein [Aquimarina muelleri]MCX2765065.1 LytTR family DNA-binding domain-containing protein [Aquimarina muelleri]GGX02817.1 DNA-binding response regulator [Aquimarina muelleri]
MIYRCLIIDDEELARDLIETHLMQLSGFEIVGSCASAIEASAILQEQTIDLLFLDIEMPVLKGIDFFKNILQKPKVIFTTAYRDYAVDGFELNAVDYLLKPITFARFFMAIEKFKEQQSIFLKEKETFSSSTPAMTNDHFIFVSKNRKKVKVIFDDILYIESLKDYVKIHLMNESHTIKYSITAFKKELDSRFIRIHRSYIVNQNKITAYTKNDIEIGAIEIPISNNYKENLRGL